MHLMLDLETLGTNPSCVSASLGAVAFNREGVIARKLFNIDVEDQLRHGRTVDGDTLAWWMAQSDRAREVFTKPEGALKTVDFLDYFETFIDESLKVVSEKRDELKPWSNGADFDIPILADMFRKHDTNGKHAIPWKFWNSWCFRTFEKLHSAKKLVPRKQTEGVKHNALDDAEFQYKCVNAVWVRQKMAKEF